MPFGARTVILGAVVALVATTLGATALFAQPGDPSVTSLSSTEPEHVGVDNSSRTIDFLVTSTANAVLVTAVVDLGAKMHGCEVSASASVLQTGLDIGEYVFSIGLDGITSTASSERIVAFVNISLDGIAATDQGYDNLSGRHTFYFLVRKSSGFDVDTTVTNATITVVCANKQL